MICEHITLTLDTLEPRDMAKAMLKFWLYQAEQARQAYSACFHKIRSCKDANDRATADWRDSDDGVGFGFGPSLPFTTTEIEREEQRLPLLKQNLDEANAMVGYMVNYITDRAHPPATFFMQKTNETEDRSST